MPSTSNPVWAWPHLAHVRAALLAPTVCRRLGLLGDYLASRWMLDAHSPVRELTSLVLGDNLVSSVINYQSLIPIGEQ